MQFINTLPQALENFWVDEAGASFSEFALIGFLVMVVVVLVVLAWHKNPVVE